jgi:hypothetical protein
MTDLDAWLAELVSQQKCRDDQITKQDLGRAWDAYLDSVLDERQGDIVAPRSEAEVKAFRLILGLLEEDISESVAAMHRVVLELTTGDDVVAVLLVVLRIVMRQIEIDHDHAGHPDLDHIDGLRVHEDDYANLAELRDGDDVVDLLLNVLKMLMAVIGDRREELRSNIQTQLELLQLGGPINVPDTVTDFGTGGEL